MFWILARSQSDIVSMVWLWKALQEKLFEIFTCASRMSFSISCSKPEFKKSFGIRLVMPHVKCVFGLQPIGVCKVRLSYAFWLSTNEGNKKRIEKSKKCKDLNTNRFNPKKSWVRLRIQKQYFIRIPLKCGFEYYNCGPSDVQDQRDFAAPIKTQWKAQAINNKS